MVSARKKTVDALASFIPMCGTRVLCRHSRLVRNLAESSRSSRRLAIASEEVMQEALCKAGIRNVDLDSVPALSVKTRWRLGLPSTPPASRLSASSSMDSRSLSRKADPQRTADPHSEEPPRRMTLETIPDSPRISGMTLEAQRAGNSPLPETTQQTRRAPLLSETRLGPGPVCMHGL